MLLETDSYTRRRASLHLLFSSHYVRPSSITFFLRGSLSSPLGGGTFISLYHLLWVVHSPTHSSTKKTHKKVDENFFFLSRRISISFLRIFFFRGAIVIEKVKNSGWGGWQPSILHSRVRLLILFYFGYSISYCIFFSLDFLYSINCYNFQCKLAMIFK